MQANNGHQKGYKARLLISNQNMSLTLCKFFDSSLFQAFRQWRAVRSKESNEKQRGTGERGAGTSFPLSPLLLPRCYFFVLLFTLHRSPLSERLEQATLTAVSNFLCERFYREHEPMVVNFYHVILCLNSLPFSCSFKLFSPDLYKFGVMYMKTGVAFSYASHFYLYNQLV